METMSEISFYKYPQELSMSVVLTLGKTLEYAEENQQNKKGHMVYIWEENKSKKCDVFWDHHLKKNI